MPISPWKILGLDIAIPIGFTLIDGVQSFMSNLKSASEDHREFPCLFLNTVLSFATIGSSCLFFSQ